MNNNKSEIYLVTYPDYIEQKINVILYNLSDDNMSIIMPILLSNLPANSVIVLCKDKLDWAREFKDAYWFSQTNDIPFIEENKKLKTTLSSGEETYIETLKNGLEHQLTLAKREYREAYDSGDADKIIEAQAKMNDAQYKLSQANMYSPKYKEALQDDKNDVYIPQSQQPSYKPDDKALKWQEKNEWFGKDEEMTSLALGLHEKLVRGGVNPTSDEYYRRIDDTMQKRFPEY